MASILSIIPYQHLIPPQNGGQLRCYYLLNQLAQHHKVYLIIFQPESELRLFSTTIPLSPNITVFSACDNPPPPSLFDKLPDRVGKALKYRWMRCKWSGTANSLLLQSYHLTQYILRTFTVDFIWLEHYISLLLIEPFIRTIKKKTIKIFDAHNVDTNLLEQEIKTLLTNSSRYKSKTKSLETANYYETRLNKFVNYFIACSDTDRITLERMNKYKIKGFVIPNGVDSNQRLFDNNPEKANSKNLQ